MNTSRSMIHRMVRQVTAQALVSCRLLSYNHTSHFHGSQILFLKINKPQNNCEEISSIDCCTFELSTQNLSTVQEYSNNKTCRALQLALLDTIENMYQETRFIKTI